MNTVTLKLISDQYAPTDPFTEYRVSELQAQLAKAQARIQLLELLLADAKVKFELLIESGGTMEILEYHKRSPLG